MNMLYDKLTNEDLEKIEYYLTHYANESKGKIYTPLKAEVSHILRFWSENKIQLFHLLGDELIVKKPITIDKDAELIMNNLWNASALTEYLCDLRSDLENIFSDDDINCKPNEQVVREYIPNDYGWYSDWERHNTLFDVKDYNLLSECLRIGNGKQWIENRYYGPNCRISLPYNDISLQKGQKMTKVVKAIAKGIRSNYNETKEIEEKALVEYSMVLNDKKLKGNLCLSVHPLDYMTMSHNGSKWRSCMKWDADGCYKAGTVEMMNSECVLEAYLESASEMTFRNDMTWNNKKWRCLYIVENDMIMSIKEYPFFNDDINKAAIEFIAELSNKNCGTNFIPSETKITDIVNPDLDYYDDYAEVDPEEFAYIHTYRRTITGFLTGLMYNDIFENLEMDHALLVDNHSKPLNERHPYMCIEYSGETECMRCGEELDCGYDTGSLLCDDCLPNHHCTRCNTSLIEGLDADTMMPVNDIVTYIDNEGHECHLCPNCAREHSDVCPFTNKTFFPHENGSLDLGVGDRNPQSFLSNYHITIDAKVFEDVKLGAEWTKEFFKVTGPNVMNYYRMDAWCRNTYIIDSDVFTRKGLEKIGYVDYFIDQYKNMTYNPRFQTISATLFGKYVRQGLDDFVSILCEYYNVDLTPYKEQFLEERGIENIPKDYLREDYLRMKFADYLEQQDLNSQDIKDFAMYNEYDDLMF